MKESDRIHTTGLSALFRKRKTSHIDLTAFVSASAVIVILVTSVFFQTRLSEKTLAANILRKGRLLIHSPSADFREYKNTKGAFHNIPNRSYNFFTSNNDTPLYLKYFPDSETYILWDTALTHLPGKTTHDTPVENYPVTLTFSQRIPGTPELSDRSVSSDFARIKKAVFQVYLRQANDPDKENFMPEPRLIHSEDVEFPENAVILYYKMPDLKKIISGSSRLYPQNVFLVVIKLQIKEIYPGRIYKDILALKELVPQKK